MGDSNNKQNVKNEVNQSKNDSNYETLMKSVSRDTAAKMRPITEGFSLSKDTNVADPKKHSHR